MEPQDDILKKIEIYREEGLKYRKQFEPTWKECEDFYQGVQFKQADQSKRVRNFVFQIVESEIPVLMDPMPSTDVIPFEDTEEEKQKSEVLNAAKDHVYREQELLIKDSQSGREMLQTGNGWQYVDFDPNAASGEGDVVVKNLSWNQVILDPSADSIDQCRYAIIDIPISNDDLEEKYPKTAKEALSQKPKDLYTFNNSPYAREDRNIGIGNGQAMVDRYESKDITYIEECWVKDNSLEAIPNDDTQIQLTEESAQLMQGMNPDISKWEDHEKHIAGHEEQKIIIVATALQLPPEQVTEDDIERLKQEAPDVGLMLSIIDDHISMHKMYMEDMPQEHVGKKPKYPNGWRLIVKTGKTKHYDGIPNCDDGMLPLVPFYCYKGRGVYASGAVINLIPMQKTINEMDEKERKGLRVAANPGWLIDEQSGIDPDTLTDEDGIVVKKKQGTEAGRLAPGQVSPQLQTRIQRDYESMQRIEGVGEAVLGEVPKSNVSGVLVRRMQMQSLGRIRLKSRMIEQAIFRRDKLIVSRIIKYWSTERKLRIKDNSGQIRFVKFNPKDLENFKYDMLLAPGTSAGYDQETIAETYKEMLQGGLIDLRGYAQIVDIPKKNELIKYLDEKDQVAAQLQQLQQENLQLKANFAPETMTPEEQQIAQQMMQQMPVA